MKISDLIKTLLNHERYQTISVILCVVMIIFMASCRPRCNSLLVEGKRVTSEELQGEIDFLEGRIQSEIKTLEQQEEIRALLLGMAQTAVSTGSFNWQSAATGALALLGGGAFVDNIRKRKAVKVLEEALKSTS
jgi:hypothetical protein